MKRSKQGGEGKNEVKPKIVSWEKPSFMDKISRKRDEEYLFYKGSP
ncbi:hypothetical protein ACFYKX_10880 [Cytobacillus sp. FJAT-54145]|uniref:Uncharacterized protein n=1 Tax=Cytobacillus spartinae TaxID=3299023 RepID=A0ABW6KA58_9BACI